MEETAFGSVNFYSWDYKMTLVPYFRVIQGSCWQQIPFITESCSLGVGMRMLMVVIEWHQEWSCSLCIWRPDQLQQEVVCSWQSYRRSLHCVSFQLQLPKFTFIAFPNVRLSQVLLTVYFFPWCPTNPPVCSDKNACLTFLKKVQTHSFSWGNSSINVLVERKGRRKGGKDRGVEGGEGGRKKRRENRRKEREV